MMDCTDRHYRAFARTLTQKTLLYTEMVTTGAIIHGDRQYLLGYSDIEHPIALQLGGSDPKDLAECSKIAEDLGYDEVNLNVGCPSDRVQAGRFGACLMKEPDLVAECIDKMQRSVSIPVTVKTRLGVDDQDSYALLCRFIEKVAATGCNTFIMHARKAWLQGLSPRKNREIPPLRYDVVYQLKRDFPSLEIIINGGIKTIKDIEQHLTHVDGVMMGREAISNPYILASFDSLIDANANIVTRKEAILTYIPYVLEQLSHGISLRHLIRPVIGLFHSQPGGKQFRRFLSENVGQSHNNADLLNEALKLIRS